MVKEKNKRSKLAYIFYEGYTEETFYKKIFKNYLNGVPSKAKNLESGTGINKEIANELIISTHTAISHRKNISEKLGIKTISGLTMYAVIKSIIDINDIHPENLK